MGLGAAANRWIRRLLPEQRLGPRGEAAAARHLKRLGYKILGRGVLLPSGELDLVALDGNTIVFAGILVLVLLGNLTAARWHVPVAACMALR